MAKSDKIILKDTSPFETENKENQKALEDIYKKLLEGGNKYVDIIGGGIRRNDDEKILYRPYESFQRCKEWTAGRFVGEASFKLEGKNKVIRLVIKPRFGTQFLVHMLEVINNYRLPESIMKLKDGDDWNNIYQLILRYLWLAKFSKADRYGLPKQTVKRTYDGVQIRGRLNVRKSIRPYFLKKEVVSEYREKEIDNTIGRIVYKAYTILSDKKNGLTNIPPQIQDSINDLISRYKGDHQIKISEREYLSINYKSIYVSWKPLVDLSWQIIKQRGFDPDQCIEEDGFGIFFDMAEIWESYIGKVLSDKFHHYTENNSNFSLFEKFDQKIIPDYISREYDDTMNSAVAVGDAKYMNLENRSKLEGEQTYSVYYKTIMYMHRFNSRKGFIFYPIAPGEDEDDGFKECQIQEYQIKNTDSSIIMVGFRVPKMQNTTNYKEELKNFQDKVFRVLES